MTKTDFQKIVSGIDREAARQGIDLSSPENTFTVWLEHPRGSARYVRHGRDMALTLEHAKRLAGPFNAIIRSAEGGRVRIIMWNDRHEVDGYAEDNQPVTITVSED